MLYCPAYINEDQHCFTMSELVEKKPSRMVSDEGSNPVPHVDISLTGDNGSFKAHNGIIATPWGI